MTKSKKIDLIEELTTYKNDFQVWPLINAIPEEPKRKEMVVKPPPPFVHMDIQSHAPYRPGARIPFDLYIERKPIVRRDPRECIVTLEKPNSGLKSGKLIKMSTVLPPNLKLNEIDSDEDLKTIIKYTYSRASKIYLDEAAMKISKKPKPPNRVVAEGNEISYKANLYPVLPPGWVGASCHWDCLQIRHLGNPDKNYWKRRNLKTGSHCPCNPVPDLLPKEMRYEIKDLILDDNLRLPYDVTKKGYCGYRPICAKGVPLEKN